MSYPIQQCSPKGLTKVLGDLGFGERKEGNRQRYPTDSLLVGECFCVPFSDVKSDKILRVSISRQAKGTVKKFAVLTHAQFDCYEVVRVA